MFLFGDVNFEDSTKQRLGGVTGWGGKFTVRVIYRQRKLSGGGKRGKSGFGG